MIIDTKDKEILQTEEKLGQNGHNPQATPSFADLLAQYPPEQLEKGQYVTGEIVQIDQNVILADVDAKRTAVVPPHDMAEIDEDELTQFNVGDEVSLYVLRTPVGDEDLLVSLNRGLEQQDWLDAKTYLADEEILELEVTGHNKGGLLVAFAHLRGFVPTSHVPQLRHIHNQTQLASKKASLVGRDLPLTVIEVDRQQRRLVLSARKAKKELRQQRLHELKELEGSTITGRITNLVKFGAFVDLDGIEGLIHISEIAWERVEDPAKYLTPGETVEVLIESVDTEQERISLSRKTLLPNPWQVFADKHNEGDLIEGVVVNVTHFGAFVDIAPGIDGLIHISEMHGTHEADPQDILYPGDTVLVRILKIEANEQRLGLSQRQVSQTEEMEWIWQQQQAMDMTRDEEE